MDTTQITEGPTATQVVLGANMEIAMAQILYQQLTPLLTHSTALVLDAHHVQRIDTAILQTLVCFHRSALARAIPFQWCAVSPALEQAAQQLGLDRVLFGEL